MTKRLSELSTKARTLLRRRIEDSIRKSDQALFVCARALWDKGLIKVKDLLKDERGE